LPLPVTRARNSPFDIFHHRFERSQWNARPIYADVAEQTMLIDMVELLTTLGRRSTTDFGTPRIDLRRILQLAQQLRDGRTASGVSLLSNYGDVI